MNKKTKPLLLVPLLLTIALGCINNEPGLEGNQDLSVVNTSSAECKNTTKSAGIWPQSIELKAVNGNQLNVTFINAILNCCTEEIVSSACIEDNILKVFFVENPPGLCDCICPYDLGCIIGNMEAREYEIEICAGGDIPDAKFSFTFSQKLDMEYEIN